MKQLSCLCVVWFKLKIVFKIFSVVDQNCRFSENIECEKWVNSKFDCNHNTVLQASLQASPCNLVIASFCSKHSQPNYLFHSRLKIIQNILKWPEFYKDLCFHCLFAVRGRKTNFNCVYKLTSIEKIIVASLGRPHKQHPTLPLHQTLFIMSELHIFTLLPRWWIGFSWFLRNYREKNPSSSFYQA